MERDAQGYPRTARRRLKKNHDDAGTVTDIDTGQRFKVRKTKGGTCSSNPFTRRSRT